MKLALVADLHGNLPATLAMEKELQAVGAEEIYFLGDAVGKGPSNAWTTDWVRANCTVCVGGNWDYGIGGKQFEEDGWFWDQLGPERMQWLNTLPQEAEFTMSGIRFRIFHGRPLTKLLRAQSPKEELEPLFSTEHGDFGGVIFADSHRPFIRTLNCGYIMNTGSVGNSLGVTNAHAILLEGEMGGAERSSLRMSVLAVPYDIQEAVRLAVPELPHRESYIREILTGEYSRT